MATSDNFEGTMPLTAPAGGATTGTLIMNATSKLVSMPMTTVTSGNTYTGKVVGLIRNSTKLSGVAWVSGQSLRWLSSTSKWAKTTINTHVSQGTAYGDATSAAILGDVVLRFPVAGVI